MELEQLQSAIKNAKARKDELERLQGLISQAADDYNKAVDQVNELRQKFNTELDEQLQGVMPENAKHIRIA